MSSGRIGMVLTYSKNKMMTSPTSNERKPPAPPTPSAPAAPAAPALYRRMSLQTSMNTLMHTIMHKPASGCSSCGN